jgi:glycosyltransferase involved in cell wall biosynthesis
LTPTPTLSVTVLSYNYGRYLGACLDAILGQTYRDFEVIVIDDTSTDGTPIVVAPYTRDPRVRSIRHEKNVGFRGSLIEGTETLSRGSFLTVISADDEVRRPDAFEIQMAALQSRPDTSMCFSAVDRFDSDTGDLVETKHSFDGDRTLEPMDALRRFLTEDIWAMHSGTIVRASAYRAAGGYARDIQYSLDTALWPMVCQEGPVAYTDQVLYGYRVHPNQMSRSRQAVRETPVDFAKLIDRSCDRAETRGWEIGDLRTEAARSLMGRLLVQDAYAGNGVNVLYEAAVALRLRPWPLLTSRRFWVAVTRALLGERAMNGVRKTAKAIRSSR